MRIFSYCVVMAFLAVAFVPASVHADSCVQDLATFGAIPDNPSIDNSNTITAAFATGCIVDGGNWNFYVRTGVTMPSNSTLRNVRLFQTPYEWIKIRTIKIRGTATTAIQNVNVQNVTILRPDYTGDPTLVGDPQRSAGVWIDYANNVTLTDVQVVGDGKGSGIYVAYSTNVSLIRPYIHHLRWYSWTEPLYEQVQGIWFIHVIGGLIEQPRIEHLVGRVGYADERPYQTDGITLSWTQHVHITGGTLDMVGEGIDVTGSDGNSCFEVDHNQLTNIDSFGIKMANTAHHGYIHDNQVYDPGYAGFVFSGASADSQPAQVEEITILNNVAIRPGSNGRWSTRLSGVGFLSMVGHYALNYPRHIFLQNATVQGDPLYTRYGLYNEGPNENWVYGSDVSGVSIEGNHEWAFGDPSLAFNFASYCQP